MSRPFLTGKSIVWYCWRWSKMPLCAHLGQQSKQTDFDQYNYLPLKFSYSRRVMSILVLLHHISGHQVLLYLAGLHCLKLFITSLHQAQLGSVVSAETTADKTNSKTNSGLLEVKPKELTLKRYMHPLSPLSSCEICKWNNNYELIIIMNTKLFSLKQNQASLTFTGWMYQSRFADISIT